MSNVDVYIVVEGQTEQTFVRDVLAPHLAQHGIFLYAALIGTPGHKGGDIRFDRAKIDICNFLKQRPDTYISTMFDFFRIEGNWPGKTAVDQAIKNGSTLTAVQKAEILHEETLKKMVQYCPGCNAERRFIPYIEMHEFEALLFSDAEILASQTDLDILKLQTILAGYSNPEEINDDPQKAPSKRLEALQPGYRKVSMGKSISEAIGIPKIRHKCSHFDEWIKKLLSLPAAQRRYPTT